MHVNYVFPARIEVTEIKGSIKESLRVCEIKCISITVT